MSRDTLLDSYYNVKHENFLCDSWSAQSYPIYSEWSENISKAILELSWELHFEYYIWANNSLGHYAKREIEGGPLLLLKSSLIEIAEFH